MKITKLPFNKPAVTDSTFTQEKKTKSTSSKRLTYQVKKNVKPITISLQVLNRTNLIPTSVVNRIFKQSNREKKNIQLQQYLCQSILQNHQTQKGKYQSYHKNYATFLSQNQEKCNSARTIKQEQPENLKTCTRKYLQTKIRSVSNQSRSYSNNINPYTHQQYIHIRKKAHKSQIHKKMQKIKEISKPCFISGIQLSERVTMPKIELNLTPRPKSFNLQGKKRTSNDTAKYLTLNGQDFIKPWDVNQNVEQHIIPVEK